MLRVCSNHSIIACRHSKILLKESRSLCRHTYSKTLPVQQSRTKISRATCFFWRAPLASGALAAGYVWHMSTQTSFPQLSQCEIETISPIPHPEIVINVEESTVWKKITRALRMIKRMIKLVIVFSPLAALYPLQYILHQTDEDEDAQEVVLAALKQKEAPKGPIGWYFKVCLRCIEWSGAAAIKVMQWAGSRPDMFGPAFCAVFSRLQDDTTPHAWKHTERALKEAFGEDWNERVRLDQIIGSGCIAQVYKGVVFTEDGKEREVAVKVMHPHVTDDIDTDLDLMRLSVNMLERLPFDVFKNLKWLNIQGFIDEMEKMLKIQLDLRTEADHLVKFNENFKDNDKVVLPELVEGYEPTKHVLLETFCEGSPVLEFIQENSEKRELLSEMCHSAIAAVCQMIFLDNFCHGDLHPGNILISSDHKFVLLDVGIVLEHSERDHVLISDILAAFIRREGRKAGRYMIEDSNTRLRGSGDRAVDEELFIDKIEKLTIEAATKGYLMERLGTYITYICNSAAQHHVLLNQSFMSAALAIKVQEGIALAMDPNVEIWRVATPIILEGERRNGRATKRAKELLGLDKMLDWVFGGTTKNERK